MYIRKIKRKCGVRGCKCIESYAISRSREPGNSIIACKSCLEAALEAIRDGRDSMSRAKPAHTAPPPLFYHPKVKASETVSVSDITVSVANEADTTVAAVIGDTVDIPVEKRTKRKKGADK